MRDLSDQYFDSKRDKGRKKKIFTVAVVLVIVAALVFILMSLHNLNEGDVDSTYVDSTKVEEGIAYLKSLEKGDVNEYQDEINHLDKEYRMAEIENNPEAVWSAFNDAVIIGDSRAYGYYFYDLVPENRVYAKGGGRITDIEEDVTYLPSIAALNPSYVFICMGLNDVGIGFYPEGKDLADKYVEEISILQEVLPNAQIIVSSILPTNEVGTALNYDFGRIGEYNDALAIICEEQGYTYVDVTDTIYEFGDPFQEDGIHLVPDYYQDWAMKLVMAME